MTSRTLGFAELPGRYSICRLSADADVPSWAVASAFLSVTRTTDELSIVTPTETVPQDIRAEHDWIGIRVSGTLDFSETGILSAVAGLLAHALIPVFAVSTFDTDFLFVRASEIVAARVALRSAGHTYDLAKR